MKIGVKNTATYARGTGKDSRAPGFGMIRSSTGNTHARDLSGEEGIKKNGEGKYHTPQ